MMQPQAQDASGGGGTRSWKRREGPTPESPEERQPFPHPDSGLQTWRNKFLSL